MLILDYKIKMTPLILCLLFLYVAINSSESFNLSPESRIIISDPAQQEGSYFGYSVHLRSAFDRYAASIVVGAPRANSTFTNHRQINEPGVVYQCNVDEFTPICYPLLLDPSDDIPSLRNALYAQNKSHSWLGAAFDGQSIRGGRFVVCAPRWMFYITAYSFFLNNGMCYWTSNTVDANQTAQQLFPLRAPNLQSLWDRGEKHYGYVFGQAGFSVHMPKTDGSEIIIGAPGLFDWKGGVIRYRDTINAIPYKDLMIPNTYNNSKISFNSLLGYSLDSGIFLSNFSSKRWYVSGAPKGAEDKGIVYLFDMPDNKDILKHKFRVMKSFTGQQLGEYFGSSLCVTDVNGDGLDDLLIGAPRYSIDSNFIETGDEGSVYVFLNLDEWRFQEQPKLQHKSEYRSEFGTSISSIGDLDFDGYNDVVVGAPYEDNGRGAIYIYLGSAKGLRPNPSQHIRAINMDSNLYGFGISVSKGVDIDNNFYNDLAVGAYLSGHVVLFKSQPVVRLGGRITSSITEIVLNTTEFSVNVCVFYNGTYVPKSTEILMGVQVDPIYKSAALIVDGNNFTTSINKLVQIGIGNEVCSEVPLRIKEMSQLYFKPLEIRLEYSIYENKSRDLSKFCSSCPVINPLSKNIVKYFIPFASGCGTDEICTPDLKISAHFINISEAFILGTKRSIFFNTTIMNNAEPAFLARLFLKMPDDLTLVQFPSFCNEQVEPFTCDLGNIVFGEEKMISFELDVVNFKANTDTINIHLTVESVGEEQNATDNNITLTLPLTTVAELKITSKSSPEVILFKDHKGVVKTSIDPISHEYVIQNLGPSPLDNAIVQFSIPIIFDNIILFKVMESETSIGTQSVRCNATWPGFEDFDEDDDLTSVEYSQIRRRREVVMNYDTHDNRSYARVYDFPMNRTQFLNCSKASHQVVCMTVICELGLLENSVTNAFIQFLIQPITENIDAILKTKTILHMEVEAVAKPLIKMNSKNNGMTRISLGTTFIGSLPTEYIPHFWMAFAISIGLLLLRLIISALIKIGFFKRTMKHKLELLKQRAKSRRWSIWSQK